MTGPFSRRRVLQGSAVALASALAGCGNSRRTDDVCGADPPPGGNRNVERAPAGESLPLPEGATWPRRAFDPENTGYNPDATGPTDAARLYWRTVFGAPPRRSAPVVAPILAAGTCYQHDGFNRLVGIDARTGQRRWTATDLLTDQPVVALDETLYVGNREGLHAVATEDREVQWSFTPPELTGQRMTTVGPRESPEPLTPGEEPPETPYPGPDPSMTEPVVTDDAVFSTTGTVDARAYAVDRTTGQRRWAIDGDAIAAATGETVYVYEAGELAAVDAADGTVRWRERNLTDTGQVAVADGRIYGSFGIGRTGAFDAETGDQLWTFRGEIESMGEPAVGAGRVFVGSEPLEGPDGGNLYAFDPATGELAWCAYLGFESVARPVVAGETVYVGHSGGVIQARDAVDGTLRWQFEGDFEEFVNLAVVDDVLLAGSYYGRLYAFGAA